jgi:hypothetical protein
MSDLQLFQKFTLSYETDEYWFGTVYVNNPPFADGEQFHLIPEDDPRHREMRFVLYELELFIKIQKNPIRVYLLKVSGCNVAGEPQVG